MLSTISGPSLREPRRRPEAGRRGGLRLRRCGAAGPRLVLSDPPDRRQDVAACRLTGCPELRVALGRELSGECLEDDRIGNIVLNSPAADPLDLGLGLPLVAMGTGPAHG